MERPRRLSAAFVKTINTPGQYGDGRGGFGLYLRVHGTATGQLSKSWAQRLRFEGQPFNLGLGSYPVVTLAAARERALANARLVEEGTDPRIKQAAIPTFADAVERTITIQRARWKPGSKTETQLRRILDVYALPRLGRKPVDAITPADVICIVGQLALAKPETARKLRNALSAVFKWAVAEGLRESNPADGNIANALPRMGVNEHRRAIPHGQIAGAVRIVRESGAWLGTKLALEFLILTAARSGEVRNATWEEIDLERATWTVPADRMKGGRVHRVPLPVRALEILAEARPLGDGEGLIFPSSRGKALSDGTLSKALRDNRIPAVPHGFRSTFRDWCAENNVDRQVAESALAHAVGDATESAYLRSDVFELRRDVMERWADYVTPALETLTA